MIQFSHPRFHTGFTLVELVVVIILLGILSVYAVPRFIGVQDFRESGFYQEIVSATRYAKNLAVAKNTNVVIYFKTEGYSLEYQTNDGKYEELDPNKYPVSSANSSDVLLSNDLPKNATFNALGRCVNCNDTLTINVNGRNMTIYEDTGYVDTE